MGGVAFPALQRYGLSMELDYDHLSCGGHRMIRQMLQKDTIMTNKIFEILCIYW